MRPEESGGGGVTGFCFGVWPFPHRIPREQHSSPVKAQGFPGDWSDAKEGVNWGEGDLYLPVTHLLCRL